LNVYQYGAIFFSKNKTEKKIIIRLKRKKSQAQSHEIRQSDCKETINR